MSVKPRFVGLAAMFVLGLAVGDGWAEKVTTNQSTKLYSRAGEQAPVILKLKSGQKMTVLAKDGRWVKVRVSGRTGWVPRSKVDMPEGDEIARNTRRRPFVDGRGTKRGFGGEGGPEDRVGADAIGEGQEDAEEPERPARKKPSKPSEDKPSDEGGDDDEVVSVDEDDENPVASSGGGGEGEGEGEAPAQPMAHVAKRTVVSSKPDKNSEEAFTADPSMALYVGRTKGDWTRVSNDDGDAGYVLTSKLDIEDADEGGGGRRRIMEGRGRLGVTLIKQSLSSSGAAMLPDNYSASSSSITVALGGQVLYPYKAQFWVGGELTYDFNKAIPGISYMDKSNGFSYHVLNLRAVGGYDLKKKNGMTAYARVGLHYDSFQVANVGDFTKNTAKLPNQIIQGPSLGGALGIPKLTPKLGLLVSLDFMPFASVEQTKNLEDGTDPGARGLFLGGKLTYRWKPKMDLQFTYDMTYTSLSFGGAAPTTSLRGHTGMGAPSGTDFNNALTGGIAYAF